MMNTIARPDGRDMSVSSIPFHWDSHSDIRSLRVGYLKEAFEETTDPAAKRFEQEAIAKVQTMGFQLIPLKVPQGINDAGSFGVESAAFFDQLIRSGGDKQMTNPGRAGSFRSSRLIPAVEYLQSQRARTMMMMKLAEATADVDVYLVPVNSGGGGGRGRAGAAPGDGAAGPATPTEATPPNQFRRSVAARHFSMANSAGYPAVNVPNGFTIPGRPLL